jgi:hypothetical protein
LGHLAYLNPMLFLTLEPQRGVVGDHSIHFKQNGRYVTFAIVKLVVINTKNKQFKKVRVITGEEFVQRVVWS